MTRRANLGCSYRVTNMISVRRYSFVSRVGACGKDKASGPCGSTSDPGKPETTTAAQAKETTTLLTKVFKLATELGVSTLQELGYPSKAAFQEKILGVLRTHR